MAGVDGASSSVLGLASRRLILRLATAAAAAALTFVPTCSAYVASSRAALNFPAHAPLRRQTTGRSRHHQNALAPGALGLRASMRGYRKSLVHGRVGKLEKMSRGVFDLQDALLQLKVMELEEEQEFRVTAGPAEPAPKRTAVVGSGPAGLATAIMMARRGWENIVLYDRLPPPPRSDSGEWGDPERSYNIGMDAKGQGCLKDIGAWERVEPHCAEVVGRVDWMPGSDEPQEVDFIEKFGYPIKVIQRDCLTALLREEIEENYAGKIEIVSNIECTSVTWGQGDGDPVLLEFQKTQRVHPKGEVRGARPTVVPEGEPFRVLADFVVGADGASSRVRDAMETDPNAEEGFQIVRFPDTNERVFKTISLTVPEGRKVNVDYSAVSLEDIIIDALPLQDGKMIGVVLFRPHDTRVTSAKTPEEAKALFQTYLPTFMDFIDDDGFAAFAAKREQRLPAFQYCGPVVHRRANTVLLGDAIHTVKPFFGFGINTALDDIKWLDRCLSAHPSSRADALRMFSEERGTEAVSIVEISHELDQPGLKGLAAFLGPLILDSIFEKIMPGVFHPNLLIYCRQDGVTFTEARRRKKRDLTVQLSFLSAQMLWGGTAALTYSSERAGALMLATAERASALMSLFPSPPLHVSPMLSAILPAFLQ